MRFNLTFNQYCLQNNGFDSTLHAKVHWAVPRKFAHGIPQHLSFFQFSVGHPITVCGTSPLHYAYFTQEPLCVGKIAPKFHYSLCTSTSPPKIQFTAHCFIHFVAQSSLNDFFLFHCTHWHHLSKEWSAVWSVDSHFVHSHSKRCECFADACYTVKYCRDNNPPEKCQTKEIRRTIRPTTTKATSSHQSRCYGASRITHLLNFVYTVNVAVQSEDNLKENKKLIRKKEEKERKQY